MDPYKILFADVDGVLNYEEYYERGRWNAPYPLNNICPLAIYHLNRIVLQTGCKIVLSAGMRSDGIEVCRDLFREVGCIGEIIDVTSHLTFHHKWAERGNEILKWLQDNGRHKVDDYYKTDHDYAIIDDDCDMLYIQRNNFFRTSEKTGLNAELADRVIAFLNAEPFTPAP